MTGPTRYWTLRQRITALCVVVGLMLVALAATAAGLAAANRGHLDDLITRGGPLRVGAERLMAAMVDQDAGLRGFAATGMEADLAPYHEGASRQRQLVEEMTGLLGSHPKELGLLRQVDAEATRWRQQIAEQIIATVRARGPDAGRALINDAARTGFEGLRASVEELQQAVLRLRDEVAADARRTGNGLVLLLVCAAVVVLIAGGVLLVLLQRLVTRPVTELASQVRAVAAGKYDREIASQGPPELAALARDVDAMRRKISSELAEVREARGQVQWVNEQLQAQAAELTRSNGDLEQFAYVASHDLQEPLRKVASFCQLLQRRYAGQIDPRADQYIAFAVDGAQRMQRLINDLLAFSRIGRLTAGFTDVNLNLLLVEVAAQVDGIREAVDGELTWTDLPVVEGEEPLLGTLFANLVSNSLKFRRPGTAPKVHVSARKVDNEWEITVADNGIGIEREFADKVFVIFQRLHARDAYEGTGIGLAIVKKIVEYHGGRVWLDPVVPEGTTIRFTLPGALVAEEFSTPSADVDQLSAESSGATPKETVA